MAEASKTIKAAAASKPRKPVAAKPAAPIATPASAPELPPAVAEIAETLPVMPAQLAETIEAVTSPALVSDAITDAAEAAAPINEGIDDMATATAPSPSETADKAQALFGDYSTRFKTAFEKSSKIGEDLVDFSKGNVEALIASARVAAKGAESLGQEAAEYGKKNFETATQAFKSFATVKSPTELFQLQSEFAKSSFDSAVAEASKFSESMLKLVGDIAQPLSTRYALAAEKFKGAAL